MNFIEYRKNNSKMPPGIFQSLCLVAIIAASELFVVNTVAADTEVPKETEVKEDKAWYEGTFLDGTWIPQSIQIHGFFSQGMNHTSDNNFFGNTDDTVSFDFREIGLNASWRVIPELQLSLQVVYRDAGLTDDDGVRIDYGLADYSFFSSESTLLGIRAGRVPTPLGLYNDTRDVASTRPGIILPQSIYFDVNRNIALSADGGYFYGEQRTDYGDFLLHAGAVIPRSNDPDIKYRIARGLPGKMEGDLSWVTRLNYEWQSGMVRLAITYADFNGHYEPVPGTVNLLPGTLRFNPLIFSAQYNAENWSLTAEYALRRLRLDGYGTPLVDRDETGESFYVQGTYKFTSYMEAMIRYDHYIADKDDKDGEKYAATIGAVTGDPAYSRFAKDLTFGLRFTVIPKLLVSAEYHYVEGTGWLSGLENPDLSKTSKYWSLYMLMLSYDF